MLELTAIAFMIKGGAACGSMLTGNATTLAASYESSFEAPRTPRSEIRTTADTSFSTKSSPVADVQRRSQILSLQVWQLLLHELRRCQFEGSGFGPACQVETMSSPSAFGQT